MSWQPKQFGLARLMTTPRRLAEIADEPIEIEQPSDWIGQWVSITLDAYRTTVGPLAQFCPLGDNGYNDVVKFTLREITVFGSEPDTPISLGASANEIKVLISSLAAAGRSFEGSPSAHSLLKFLGTVAKATPEEIHIFDVGHANFSSVLSANNTPILHFDAGWPIGFNHATYPAKPPKVDLADIVVLSHWDWDHLHGYYKWPDLKKCIWATPAQVLGPGALRIALELDRDQRLISIGVDAYSSEIPRTLGCFRLHDVDPGAEKNKAKRRNNSGLALRVYLPGGKLALMPGDADYDKIVARGNRKPDLLFVSHHGAAVSGNIVNPRNRNGRAVVSLGLGNKYGHPCPKTLASHEKIGWKLSMTCEDQARKRGDRIVK
ncbi:hypothetical protein MWU61_18525 [Loktanella sp. F6476L]|uniref:hypothetical protein n=1 Tax=Loktanella sp. F6476L TaxID=2926405 RepID=UPI001FF5A038|nr:hypothetical protein [Loktanella sp. F6476L]MCK0122554.1 hypothetical protein [Loktanella sp. F6476L]